MSITSIVVLHSSQLGVANLVTKSYRDLQSVINNAFGSVFKAVSGYCHLNVGSTMYPHKHLSQDNLSSEELIAYASALRVDLTTLPICFEFHDTGLMSDDLFSASSGVQATMKSP